MGGTAYRGVYNIALLLQVPALGIRQFLLWKSILARTVCRRWRLYVASHVTKVRG